MSEKKVSSVTFAWNRGERFVRTHLFTLANQSCGEPSERFLVDFSTDMECVKINTVLCEKFGFIHVWCPMRIWCKPLGMNIGIKKAKHQYIALIDIDQVICKDFFKVALPKLAEDTWVGTHSWMSPPGFAKIAEKNIFDNWEQIIALCQKKGRFNGQGIPIHILSRKWLWKVHGMNENYIKWGAMDNELHLRAQWDGLKIEILPKGLTLHQYHKPEKVKDEQWKHTWAAYTEVRKKQQVIVNLDGWGKLNGKSV